MKKTVIFFIVATIFFGCSSIYEMGNNENSSKSTEKSSNKKIVGKKSDMSYQEEILKLANIEREKNGLSPLILDKKLCLLSGEKANDMAKNNYFSHNSKVLGTPFEHMKKNGVKYRTAAENIAKGQKTPEEVMNTWKKSPGHRKNILNPKFHKMGINKDELGQDIWVQLFTGQ